MRVLVDTNVLLRTVQSNHPHFAEATTAIATLVRRGDSVFFSPQNIAEFWNVATRPAFNTLDFARFTNIAAIHPSSLVP